MMRDRPISPRKRPAPLFTRIKSGSTELQHATADVADLFLLYIFTTEFTMTTAGR